MTGLEFMLLMLSLLWHPAVPPPVEQSNTNCANPTYASDYLVCEDSALREADIHLASLSSRLAAQDAFTADALWENDGEWFRRSRMCAFQSDHRECLLSAYSNRLAVVAAALDPVSDSDPVQCSGIWPEEPMQVSAFSDRVLVMRHANGIVAIATTVSASDAHWQPYLYYTRASGSLEFKQIDGRQFKCRLQANDDQTPG